MSEVMGTARSIVVVLLMLMAACGGHQKRAAPKTAGVGPHSASAGTPSAPIKQRTAPAGDASASDAGVSSPASKDASTPARNAPAAGKAVSHGIMIKGITGSLNRGEVHRTIEDYNESLLQCVYRRPRRLRWVGGRIDFHFEIGPDGRVLNIYPTGSTVGNRDLELCLTEVVARIHFRAPDGRAKTEFDWGMNVEPYLGRDPDPLDSDKLDKVLGEYAGETFETCEVSKRTRFEVTAYIGSGKNMLTAGMTSSEPAAMEKADCVLQEIKSWKMPRLNKLSKVTFELKWRPLSAKAYKRLAARKKRKTGRVCAK